MKYSIELAIKNISVEKRHQYEDEIDTLLKENKLGSVNGGGTLIYSKNPYTTIGDIGVSTSKRNKTLKLLREFIKNNNIEGSLRCIKVG